MVKFTIPSRKIPCEAFFDIAVPDDPRNAIEDASDDERFGESSQHRSDGSNFDTSLPLTELFAVSYDSPRINDLIDGMACCSFYPRIQ